ncbi:sulfatase [Kamptonema cortianum]|nr:sulfatase [Geitlerinema splendidum]MDK3158483.1 sulfatase [Kamptonema cortianum]
MYKFIASVICSCLAQLLLASANPNFVVIFCDDLGYGDLSCYGQTKYKTPHLDQMAKEGVRFTDFSVASPGCSPSRAALLTGCLPARIGINGVLGPQSKTGLSLQEETIPEILAERNYVSAIVGKWHLGVENLSPLNHGFAEYYGLPYSNDMWPPRQPPLWMIKNHDPVREIKTIADQDSLTSEYTTYAKDFIRRNRTRPFFLYLAHSMPHVPLGFGGRLAGKSGAGRYGDVIREIDWSTGEILKELKRQGLDAKTLVIFTSDNGPWLPYGNHAGSSGSLREGKGTVFEGGVRVPCIARWPGKVPAGVTSDTFWTSVDILPTMARLSNASLPKEKIDGIDATDVLFHRNSIPTQRTFPYYLWSGDLQALRWGRWKLHFPHLHRHQAEEPGRDGASSGEVQATIELSLFDLMHDPGETRNLAQQYPDVVRRMHRIADYYRMELGDSSKKVTGRAVRAPGTVIFPTRLEYNLRLGRTDLVLVDKRALRTQMYQAH